ncbi:MAG: hypothetical protein ABEH66_03335 [Halobacteriales archaeon]
MPDGPWVDRSYDHPNILLRCSCGWEGIDADVESWDVQVERDRVVRECPGCGRPVPEWGTLPSIDGAAKIARGPLNDALVEAGVIEE